MTPTDVHLLDMLCPICGRRGGDHHERGSSSILCSGASLLRLDELAPLRRAMTKGRRKYPQGCTALSLLDEAGEVAHALNKRESVERVREKLLDVAGVAMRLYLGEIDTESVLVGLVQHGARCRSCRKKLDHGFTICARCVDKEGP